MSLVGTVGKHTTVFSIQYIRCAMVSTSIATIFSPAQLFPLLTQLM